jgi:AraC-like DNA-binding protein
MPNVPDNGWPVKHEGFAYQSAFLRTYETPEHDLPEKLSLGWMTTSSRAYDFSGAGRYDIRRPAAIFQYTLAGQGILELGGHRHTLGPGWAFLLQHPGAYRYYWPGGAPWEMLHFTLFGLDAMRHVRSVLERCGSLFELTPEAPVIRLLFTLLDEIPRENPVTAEAAAVSTYRMAMALRALAEQQRARYPSAVALVKNYLLSHFNTEVTLAELADVARVTPTYLCHLFRAHLGVSPMRYLLTLRLQQAQTMLRDTQLSSQAIGELCGFRDAGYFCTIFRIHTGVSPLTYRRQQTAILQDP